MPQIDSEVTKAKNVLQLPAYAALAERLGEYFPNSDMSWLTDEYDDAFASHFTSDQGGWLTPQQDTDFWSLIEGSSESEASDALSTWLKALIDEWDQAQRQPEPGASDGEDADESDDEVSDDGSRFDQDQITRVGDDYPGMWQGYDQVDEVWKYIRSSDKPTGDSPGWMVSAQAFSQEAGSSQSEGAVTSGASDLTMQPSLEKFVGQLVAAAKEDKLAEFFGFTEDDLPEDHD